MCSSSCLFGGCCRLQTVWLAIGCICSRGLAWYMPWQCQLSIMVLKVFIVICTDAHAVLLDQNSYLLWCTLRVTLWVLCSAWSNWIGWGGCCSGGLPCMQLLELICKCCKLSGAAGCGLYACMHAGVCMPVHQAQVICVCSLAAVMLLCGVGTLKPDISCWCCSRYNEQPAC
jgi:hypothetical protein